MKGQIIMRFAVPNRGIIANVPPDQLGSYGYSGGSSQIVSVNNALTDGNNVYIDLDGRLKTRLGPTSISGLPLATNERVLGLYSYEDNDGVFFPIAATQSRWFALIANSWVDLSGPLLSGDANDQVRFTPFASNGFNWAIGTNNVNPMYEWNSNLMHYQTVPNSPVARDVVTLANRVVAFNTVESGTRYPFRVRWSAINDQTTWPALGFADLIDSGCSIVGVALTSRISAVIYRQFAGWLIQAVPGGDANAFVFDRIPAGDHMTGPVGPGSIVIAEGNHYYLGIDGRVYMYNGSSIQPISDPIDPITRGLYNMSNPTRFTSTYLPAQRQLCFFFAKGTNVDPSACIVYDLRLGCFLPIWTFPFNITASSEMREATGPNWTNWVPVSSTWNQVPFASWSSIPQGTRLVTYTGTDIGNVDRFMTSNVDNIAGPITGPPVTWLNWVGGGITWLTIPFSEWKLIPGPTQGPSQKIPIPYSASWGLQRGTDEFSQSLVHFIEVYQQEAQTAETVVAQILGYLQPLGVNSEVMSVTSLTMNLADQTTFYQTTAPGPFKPQNLKSNLLQLVIQSAGVLGQLNFAGCSLMLDVDVRGDYAGNGPQ